MMRSESISMVLRPILSPKWEDQPTYGPRHKADRVRRGCSESPRRLAELREKQRRKDKRRSRAVEEEVIPFNSRPDKTGHRHLAYRGCLSLALSTQTFHKNLLCTPGPDPSGPPIPTTQRILRTP